MRTSSVPAWTRRRKVSTAPYLGPTLLMRVVARTQVDVRNELDKMTTVHW